jgi:hypothetical protein
MTDRSRIRRGREVAYTPTAAEEAALGAGPWPGIITKVNADGTCDLAVDPPGASSVGAALTDPLVTTANASDLATAQALANANKVAINAMVTRLNQVVVAAGRKASVHQGGAAGQFSLSAGPDTV